jgi:hypothetical protein
MADGTGVVPYRERRSVGTIHVAIEMGPFPPLTEVTRSHGTLVVYSDGEPYVYRNDSFVNPHQNIGTPADNPPLPESHPWYNTPSDMFLARCPNKAATMDVWRHELKHTLNFDNLHKLVPNTTRGKMCMRGSLGMLYGTLAKLPDLMRQYREDDKLVFFVEWYPLNRAPRLVGKPTLEQELERNYALLERFNAAYDQHVAGPRELYWHGGPSSRESVTGLTAPPGARGFVPPPSTRGLAVHDWQDSPASQRASPPGPGPTPAPLGFDIYHDDDDEGGAPAP